MKRFIFKLLIAGVLTLTADAAASSFASPPVGSYPLRVNASGDTSIGLPLERAGAYAGRIQSVKGSTIRVVGEPGWQSDYWSGMNDAGEIYFCQIITGELAGASFTIMGNTDNTLHVLHGYEDLGLLKRQAAGETGDTIRIVPYWTPETLFAHADVPDRTQVLVYESEVGIAQFGYQSFTYHAGAGWKDATGADVSTHPLRTDRGMIVRGTGEAAIEIDLLGFVPVVARRVVINGFADIFGSQMLFTVGSPEAIPVNLSGLDVLDRTRITTQAEYRGKTFIPSSVYTYHADFGWLDQAFRPVGDDVVLEPGKAYFVRVPRARADMQWVWSHTPDYVDVL